MVQSHVAREIERQCSIETEGTGMGSSEQWYRKSKEAEADTNKYCQVHQPQYAAGMARARLYMARAIFWELRNARLDVAHGDSLDELDAVPDTTT